MARRRTMTMGDRIKALREQRGWSQNELAQRLGLKGGFQHISKWENGQPVGWTNTLRLAEVFEVSFDELGVSEEFMRQVATVVRFSRRAK